jgi:regulatory protein
MLRARQIGEQHLRQALDEINHDAYKESCLSQLREKNRTVRAGSNFERRGKLFRYASGKGFEADLIYPLLDQLGMEED